MNKKAYIIFTRIPTPNRVKTRLMSTYTGQQASDIQADLLADLLASALSLPQAGIDVLLAYSDEQDPTAFLRQLPAAVHPFPQHGENIGERMNNAMKHAFDHHYDQVVLTGSDLPDLTAATIKRAFSKMTDIVIGPSLDGGYYLIGSRRGVNLAPLFTAEIDWGHASVLRETLSQVAGYDVQLVEPQSDIDFPEDLAKALQHLDSHNQALGKRMEG